MKNRNGFVSLDFFLIEFTKNRDINIFKHFLKLYNIKYMLLFINLGSKLARNVACEGFPQEGFAGIGFNFFYRWKKLIEVSNTGVNFPIFVNHCIYIFDSNVKLNALKVLAKNNQMTKNMILSEKIEV